jgi:hypothetical protein
MVALGLVPIDTTILKVFFLVTLKSVFGKICVNQELFFF